MVEYVVEGFTGLEGCTKEPAPIPTNHSRWTLLIKIARTSTKDLPQELDSS